jgi:hypothetical protein
MGRSGKQFRDKFKSSREQCEKQRQNKRRFLMDNRDGSNLKKTA